jgi:hypothetical protein
MCGIVQTLVQVSSTERLHHIELSPNLRDAVTRFHYAVNKLQAGETADAISGRLSNEILNVLLSAYSELSHNASRPIKSYDIILINTDAERHFVHEDRYFEPWAQTLVRAILTGVDRFYHVKIQHGFTYDDIPLVLPLILFPSTDVIIAAARSVGSAGEGPCHGHSARDLKQRLYDTDELSRLSTEDFTNKALKFLTPVGCARIYSLVPETRLFFRHLVGAAKATTPWYLAV